ncbi:hypothetical protein Poli38472_003734 [Pythium oligandrum]|uniref:ABC transporter domain-containing protein n=1 Tax=Pythium oligandrum TaxID=41045 RepID=A0A8K1FM65_PYTOL|nr:hypothetical protein Poli38472_003734 [Pythium oligandrum]|eukprot:TMW65969.1 hypothetical protein Poli38472_003734 [Pythium oligandrum]
MDSPRSLQEPLVDADAVEPSVDVKTAMEATQALGHDSGKALLARGPEVLHEYVTSTMETAMKRALPRMEIRFRDLSLSAKHVVMKQDSSSKSELPTLTNEVKKAVKRIRARKNVVEKPILHEISGVFRPGTMTLVLGQPGSGKSSLLKILSGRFPISKDIKFDGMVTYNGAPRLALTHHLPQFVSYVTQHDTHFGALTVKETFEYAHKFSGIQLPRHTAEMLKNGSPEETKAAEEAIRSMFEHYPEIVIELLGLKNCEGTIIGDSLTRGVSGGERKRVTLGEMEFGLKYVSFMDEISTGLDSAAAYDIVKTQRSIADKFKKTIVMSLLQPTPEVVALFDEIMLLNEGHVIYYGPRADVMKYFEDLGLTCPSHRDHADFLMDIGTSQQRQYENERSRATIPHTAEEFGAIYKRSEVYAKILDQLEEPHDPVLLKDVEDHMDPMPPFQQSLRENLVTLLQRQVKVTYRNKPLLLGRSAMVIVIGLLYASVFYQFDPRDVQIVMGTLFASVFFVSMSQFSQLPTLMAEREIFYKQRGANFVRSSTYVTSYMISQIPTALLEVVIFGSLTYWMCGFASSATAFINFEVILFLMNLCFTAWYMVLAAWAPDLHVVEPVGLVTLLFYVLFAGFVIFKSQLPDYLVWLYWLDPIAWSLRAVAVNQYRSAAYDVCMYEETDYCLAYNRTMGEYYLSLYDIPSERYWIEYGMLFLLALAILFVALTGYLLEYKRHEAPENHDAVAKVQVESGAELDTEEKDSQYTLLRSPKSSANVPRVSIPLPTETVLDIAPTAREKNFVPVTLAFKDLRYSVQDPNNPKQQLELLKGITGLALPGSVTALMGASGAGKTTLMDVIAGRKTEGTISGSILMNGYEATDLVIRRSTGYCEQVDVHLESATFREALTFSAFLRQSSDIPDATKFDSVNECLELLDLTPLADRIIRGSTIEQRKRLTIGVELAAQPSVIFLDEPTSGLDARSAKVIMDGVRKVADSGRTIVCTIHQPSAEVFYLFDSLLLLKKGGETVFYGDLGSDCRNLIDYFESISGLKPLPSNYNPATWMLECIGAGVSNEVAVDVDFVEHFKASEHRRILDERLDKDGVTRPADGVAELKFANKRAASGATQFRFLLRRSFALYWRSASYNLTRFGIALCLAVLFWIVFGSADYATYQGLSSGIGMVFLTSLFNGIVSFNSVLPIANEERNAFYRERASQTYNAFWYFVASTIVEIPYVFVSGLLFSVIFFPAVGFEGFATGVLYWINVSLLILMQTYFGQFLAYAFPTVEVAAIVGILLNSVCFLFMGFVPPTSKLPSGYKWLAHITPQRYPFMILSALVFSDCDNDPLVNPLTGELLREGGSNLGCQVLRNAPRELGTITVKGFVEGVFKMKYEDIWVHFAITIGFVFFFRLLGLLALRFINHQKR